MSNNMKSMPNELLMTESVSNTKSLISRETYFSLEYSRFP